MALAAGALGQGRRPRYDALADRLDRAWTAPAGLASPAAPPGAPGCSAVPVVLSRRLVEALGAAWERGWQPADLPRVAGRRLGPRQARLSVDVIAAEAVSYRYRPEADPHWLRQLDELHARVWWTERAPHLESWARREGLSRPDVLRCALELLGLLWYLPSLPRLCPPPSAWGRGPVRDGRPTWGGGAGAAGSRTWVAAGGADPKILARVRALLAKAESTTFPEEAEALTAKAQQLMTRYAIDQAMIEAEGGPGVDRPGGRHVGVDDPYASAKALLLARVASASDCRAVWNKDLGFSTVFGFDTSLDAVELLYTSLLVQATTAMVAAGGGTAGAHRRSRSFRQSFLAGFADRIGQRLRDAAGEAVKEATADHGQRLLPVLAGRAQAVEEACAAAFPALASFRTGVSDGGGWAAGRAAAELASLSVGPGLEARSSP